MAMLKIINIILLILIVCNNKCLCDICRTCECSVTADGWPIIDCHKKHFGTNDALNFDLLTLNQSKPLNKLILSKNSIVFLPSHILKKLKYLKKLDLSQNKLDIIHVDIFKNLNNLEELDYSNNFLWGFDVSILSGTPSLVKLNLSHNEISSLEGSSQNINTKLKVLDLSHNNITSLHKNSLDSLMQLVQLDLSFNKLVSLETNTLANLKHLKIFRISNNRLFSLNFQDFPLSLRELHAGSNFINALLFKKSFIRILNIENNHISKLQTNITFLEELKHLNLSGNFLSSFPEIILRKLELLDLSYNNFSIIPELISAVNFPTLRIFGVNGNRLNDVRIRSKLRLEVFEANYIDTIQEIGKNMFLNLTERENECINVNIANNTRLSIIDENVFQHMNICSLNLNNNHFTQLSSKLISNNRNKNAKYIINLQGNPFVCNCSLQWMLDDLVPYLYITKISFLENLRCAGPPPLTNKRLVHWYRWQDKVFCGDMSPEKLSVHVAGLTIKKRVTFETSSGMIAILSTALVLFVILVIIGILMSRKMLAKRRRYNRRF